MGDVLPCRLLRIIGLCAALLLVFFGVERRAAASNFCGNVGCDCNGGHACTQANTAPLTARVRPD